MVPVVAAIWFVVYYVIFRFAITRFNLKTPGRDSEVASSIEKAVAGAPGKSGYNVPAILEALGGADNIVSLDNCITRLRLSVKDMSLVNVQALKDNRAIGVVQLNQHKDVYKRQIDHRFDNTRYRQLMSHCHVAR